MKRVIAVGAALLAAAIVAVAAGGEPDFSAERFRAHVAFLSDDLLEGREAGTRGHEIAARYIASQFAFIGAKPGGTEGSYFQSVGLLESALTGPVPRLTLRGPHGSRKLKHGDTAIIQGPIAGGTAKVDAPLVFAGFGIQDAAVGIDDYAGLDVRGKIVVALFGSPKNIDSEVAAHLLGQQNRVAAEHGAVGVISVFTRAVAAAFPWEKVVENFDTKRTTWVRQDGTPADSMYGLKTWVMIKPSVAAVFFDGAPETLDHILDEADKADGRPKGFALRSTARISVATNARRYTSPEVIAVIEGSDARLKDEYVALMGHADHIGIKSKGTGDRINNGALDNAAGVATLLEVARRLTIGERPRRSILVVANTAEEKGLLGAEYFANYPPVSIDRVTAAVDLDMPLLTYDFTDVVAYGASHSTLADVFQKAGAAMGIKLSPDPMPEQAVFVRSDHYAMVKKGVPAVMLATGMANGGEAAWGKYLASNYHQPSDDVSLPIVWNAGAKFAEFNYRVVRMLADADARAQWYARDYFGDLFAAKAPKAEKP